ncbi:hypothetical protein AB0E83_08465 [Streptomyces sp. NPDC035033]
MLEYTLPWWSAALEKRSNASFRTAGSGDTMPRSHPGTSSAAP